jgi:DNA gyrase subunit A
MKLKTGDELIGMDILPAAILNTLNTEMEEELTEVEETSDNIEETSNILGPWVLIITIGGYGKRVPVGQFRLQNRAGQGLTATKFKNRKTKDQLATLRIVNPDEEIMMATNRGIIIRQSINAISIQSRTATGVRVQKLDEDDAITGVAVVPPDAGDGEESE